MPDPYILKTRRERYQKIKTALFNTRSSGGFDADWRDLGDYLLPRRTRFWTGDRNKAQSGSRNQKIIDSTGRFAARTLASGLHAGLTSPARPWMKLTTPDPELATYEPVKEWLHDVTARMLTIFVQSNLYNALPIVYGDLGCFGTAAMSILDDTRDVFRAYPYPIGMYALGLDARGVATTFARQYELTVRQVVETFAASPDRKTIDRTVLSDRVWDMWDKGDYEEPIEICWLTMPNDAFDKNRIESKYLPWSSCHFEATATPDRFLRESGFKHFPVLCPRWDVGSPEDSYGTDCPGMTALGDVKQLQIMQKRKAQAIEKQVYPPLVGPNALRTQKTSLLPGDITYVDTREGQNGLRSIHEVNINLADMTADIRETQYRIQRAFYEDLFLMLAQQDQSRGTLQPMTAREVDERHEEKLLALGPVLERTNDELLDPLVDRVYSMMDAVGLIPEPPDELTGVKLKVEYISILSQAQKLVGVIGQDRFLQATVPLMASFPEVRHKVNIMQAVDNYGEMLGVDPRVVVPTEEAEAALQGEQQQVAAAQAAQQTATLAGAAKDASQARLGQGTALDALLESAGSQQPAGSV